jgi:hypothetical protein
MKRLDVLIARQKNRTHFDGLFFKKMRLDHKKGSTKLDPFYSFS